MNAPRFDSHRSTYSSPNQSPQRVLKSPVVDVNAELERTKATLRRTEEELEKVRAEKSVLITQQAITALRNSLIGCKQDVSSIGSVIKWINGERHHSSDELWVDKSELDFSPVLHAQDIYDRCLGNVRSDLTAFNEYFRSWNQANLEFTLIEKVREWLTDAGGYPTEVKNLLLQILDFKRDLQPTLDANFLTFEPQEVPRFSKKLSELKKTFKTLESKVLSLENKPEFRDLLKKMHKILQDDIDAYIPVSPFQVLYPTSDALGLRLEEVDSLGLTGWVADEHQLLEKNNQHLYRQLLEATSRNWLFVINELLSLTNTLQCLEETIDMILPIRELQTKTVAMRSLSKTTIDASRENTQKAGKADQAKLVKELVELEKSFKDCLLKSAEAEELYAQAKTRLVKTNHVLLTRLTVQTDLLKQLSRTPEQATQVTSQVDLLRAKIDQAQVLLSSDLNAAWNEISEKLPETARYLDQIDYAVNNYKGFISTGFYFTLSYSLYGGKYYTMYTERNKAALTPSPSVDTGKELPGLLPDDEDAETAQIPIQQLNLQD